MENKISWKALEYKRKEKTVDWYWAVGLIALAVIVTSIILHDTLFAILILISTIILVSFSIADPRIVQVSINRNGITVEKEMYPFSTIESFWIESTDRENRKVLLKSKRVIMPLIAIPLEELHHQDVREYLLQYLPEIEMHEPLSQKIMERLGF